ncbi:DEAD/DEAH box helicase [Nocardia takedensis]|uniref:DEAD/DEAH box helicase n=1 Tax=Nocardia takedensis TaxID=259390 RepID=UPI001C3F1FD7|nr:DEAD/DEAH box helicase [Nocardia takedensis]
MVVPVPPPGTDIRVLLPSGDRFARLRDELRAEGIPFRDVNYLLEQEIIGNLTVPGATTATIGAQNAPSHRARPLAGAAAEAARDGFEYMWHNHLTDHAATEPPVPVGELVPADWIRFLPHAEMNPAQAQAVPHILGDDDHLLVIAPTGAGKTVIGMVAVLRTLLEQGKKAAWLVPQRSLTEELLRELDSWRHRGLAVERLTGEYRVDAERIRAADLWVTTTEKFEAISRTSSLREALTDVGCLVVDEIHMLGDTTRGSFLEAILARVLGADRPPRIVGLSATVANADQLAAWLRARAIHVAWRPTRQIWQLPTVANSSDWSLVEGAKARLTTKIVAMVTGDNGSVLVFCGSKRNVRRTALMIAANRGADVFGVDLDDADEVHRVCRAFGVGLHYKGWEHRQDAETAFRTRESDVLVATSTVAAGVNLPARAVVVQDTEVGLKGIDVATVQQMFGRAGRLGAGERDGWAFLLVDESERTVWQRRLLAGFRVNSQIRANLSEHLLAEVVQDRIHSVDDAERWHENTLFHHQGNRESTLVHGSITELRAGDFLTTHRTGAQPTELSTTELGVLTARLMVSPRISGDLRDALADSPIPESPEEAEQLLIETLALRIPKLSRAAISEDIKPRAVAVRAALGRVDRTPEPEFASSAAYACGDLARAALFIAANAPDAFRRDARVIHGIPYATMYPVLAEAPRYLHWLGCQGYLGTVHPWIAVVAADLGRRIRWRRCNPTRGAGRLLWMCEQMATSVQAEDVLPVLWRAATARGITHPDWTETGRPQHCRLDPSGYATLLHDRATDAVLTIDDDSANLTCSSTAMFTAWAGSSYATAPVTRGRARIPAAPNRLRGAAVFTRRGDYRATGWLAHYNDFGHEPSGAPAQLAQAPSIGTESATGSSRR